ncbi:MAG: beta-ketoacyl-ACP synthase [Woeseiaceae bacterium]|nr:beta-ketoacyl-ACP synthase [Woeseiaceae bacterium]NIP20845.1 beta-ketoacyl-ACP synthase [Woeseiaceae bacterium]NIS89638.1 beta-ketoacyl-ACP synthase [Woeseiaceae bacterium]
MRLAIGQYTATSAIGIGLDPMREAIRSRRSGLRPNDLANCDLETWIGRVDGLESVSLPDELGHLMSRNNQLAWLGLQQDGMLDSIAELKERAGDDRIGVIIGTSTSSIGRTEEAYTKLLPNEAMAPEYCQPEVHNLHSPGIFVVEATGIRGPALTISTACSSSAKVFASAARWINHGLVDAVLVGGIDSLCMSILYGFNSLELVSPERCRPFDRRRNGINIGESCGYAIVAREELIDHAEFMLLGYGESVDAYHMSHPHPEGKGAMLAMTRALERADVAPTDVDYINLHGTASQANDRIEAAALGQLFSEHTLASSTKAWTGHTLGAAGILEAIITLEAMRQDLVPGTLNCDEPDDDFAFDVITENVERPVRHAMTNSFGFGGNNATLVFGCAND